MKPENILLDENFHIKLIDFGTARIIGEEKNSNENGNNRPARRRNSFVGTAQFVAPECLQGKEPHIANDLWALGCIIYQMITDKHLFTGSYDKK